MIFAAAIVVWQPIPDFSVWLLAMLAGALGTSGLLLLYHSMTKGLMSIATPVSALLAAVVPVVVGSFMEGYPGLLIFVGFVFALAAVWLISQSQDGIPDLLKHLNDLRLPLLAGVGFGLYFVLMHSATRNATFWPMVSSRLGGILIIAFYMTLTRTSWRLDRSATSLIVLNGLLDIGGNLFFVLAGQAGRLDIASVLSSLVSGIDRGISLGISPRAPIAHAMDGHSRRTHRHRADDPLGTGPFTLYRAPVPLSEICLMPPGIFYCEASIQIFLTEFLYTFS